MRRAMGKGLGTKTSKSYTLCSMLLALLLYGCSVINPPDDYYKQVLEMEKYGEQSRRDTGRQPGEIVAPPVRDSESVTVRQLESELHLEETPTPTSSDTSSGTATIKQEEIQEAPTPLPSEPIAVASEVIKIALKSPELGVRPRTVELVNGRLSGGKNSVRVNFLTESVNVIDGKFIAICAVIYHLDSKTNTVDVVVGIAEDEQANLVAILQSDMSDIAAWMTNKITRAEWFSKVTKKML